MDYVLPNELVDGMITAGGKKSSVSIKNLLVRGFYSGAILGLATCLAITVGVQSGMPFLGSVLFPFGFASIVLFGMELVTGNFALLPMATWAGKSTWQATFRNWIWVWIGNFIGCALVALLLATSLTSAGTVEPLAAADGGKGWAVIAAKIMALNKANVVAKYQDLGSTGFFLAFLRGMIANWLVCLGVTMALVSKSVPGKILACWLPITAFQTMGMEHIVVNMFLHTAGPMLGSGVSFGQVIVWNFIPVTLGNIIGGMVFIGMLFYSTHRTQMSNVLPTVHDEKLERELAAELGAR
ncbi:Formate and nitrite transporters [Prochlorococcus marinus str. MIT 9313]|uniref:Formate and nitrite transporters n=1 Tax=Prochlorococcus marinus (strain MIT 9313) TaxID=74547 RepID=Q7V3U8_PROMM|nr:MULTISPECIES: formate/nitrite transporter family protein [Prochlorococcus]MCH2565179.1 formate/nitrite transporter family protein [Prochlorococcus sp. ALOHA_A2.0_51]MEC7382052.1 formate/nitrite transporter family protein [Cyanobacteriota bacterium]RZO51187.1 MAG: formate/nitrite transporter family protein [Prochlorococcus sp. MED-G132]MEC9452046.1 formate/nitrite transporter family protein [Cyanobacteriota bacterium]CAE22414.1 Formate and nitrite transporters [Prochlorococcus marinus str. M